jgi:hypothetical protein
MIVLCVGRKEQGKTTLAYSSLLPMPKRVIFDPREDFETSDIVNTTGLDLYADLNEQENDEVIVQTSDDLEAAFATTCIELKDWIVEHRGERFGFLVDDSRLVLQTKSVPFEFSWMLRSTKVNESRIILTTWRVVDIPLEVRSQCDHWFIFKTTELRDLELIEERFGEQAVEMVKNLQPYHYLHADDSGPELKLTRVSDPKSFYIDIHRLHGNSAVRAEQWVRA